MEAPKKKKKAIVVGLAGKAGSGKDTVFTLLQAMVPDKEFVRLGFGDALKKEVADRHQLPVQTIEDNKEEFRALLQHWGTEYRRKQKETYWIDRVKTQVDFLRDNVDVVVITDVRFSNEVDYIKDDCDGFIVKVLGDERRELKSDHESEVGLDKVTPDWLLPNKKGVAELSQGIIFLIQELQLMEDDDG